jgi:hypothetical protein
VVVHHVQQHREAAPVAGVDEPLERVRPAVVLGHREPQHAVVAPVARRVERVDRHHLDEVDAELDEVPEPLDRGVERAARGERADVQLVDHPAGQRASGPVAVGPGEPRVVVHPGRPAHATGLPA